MNDVPVVCPHCGCEGKIDRKMAGRRLKCRQCKEGFAAPSPLKIRLLEAFGQARAHFAALVRLISFGEGIALIARATIIGGIAYAVWWVAALPRWAQIAIVVLLVFRQSKVIDFGSLLGSAKYLSTMEMRRAGYLGRSGIFLGRSKESGGIISSLWQLFVRPMAESDAAVRTLVSSIIRHKIDLRRPNDGPALFFPRYVHIMTVAPAGAGKGQGFIVPNLLRYPHSVVVTDVKSGENHRLTSHHREAMGQTIVTLDPYNVTKAGSACINPLDALSEDSPDLMEETRGLAESMIIRTGRETDQHFNEMAVTLLQSSILHTICHLAHKEDKNMNAVLHFLSGAVEVRKMAHVMKSSPCVGGNVAALGRLFDGMEPREFGSVVTSVYKNLAYLQSPLLKNHVSHTSFNINAFGDKMTVYLVLPVEYLDSHAALVRLWINTLLLAKKKQGLDESKEVLFLLDEVGNLGDMKPLEQAVTTGRGFGLRMWFILQSIKQIESNFPPPRSDTIIAGCGIKIFFDINDLATAEYVSKMAGKKTITLRNLNWGRSIQGAGFLGPNTPGSSQGSGISAGQRDLISPDEVMRSPGESFIFVSGKAPILANHALVYNDPEFAAERASDPNLRQRHSAGGFTLTPSLASWALCLCGLWYGVPILWEATGYLPMPSLPSWQSGDVPRSAGASRGSTNRRSSPQPIPPPPKPLRIAECPECGNRGPLPSDYDGEILDCRECGSSFTVTIPP